MMLPLVLLIKFIILLIIFQISFSFNLLVAFRQNFSGQIFFSLAMATKMVIAWSAASSVCLFLSFAHLWGLPLQYSMHTYKNIFLFAGSILRSLIDEQKTLRLLRMMGLVFGKLTANF